MIREIRYTETPCPKAAVLEDGKLCEYLESAGAESSGRILLGRVGRVVSGLKAAFVEIGESRDGFLPLQENSQTFSGGAPRSGERVIVQVKKQAHGSKGAFLSRDIALSGMYVILMPLNRFVGISARIREEDPEAAEKLLETGREIVPTGMGLIMRTASLNADQQLLTDEIDRLSERWRQIVRKATEAVAPAPLEEENGLLAGLIHDDLPRGIDRVVTDEPERCRTLLPDTVPVLFDEEPLQDPDLRRQLLQATRRQVRMDHGGNLVIDCCEALTVIDVNTASDTGRNALVRTDLEAVPEIVRQVRLRNLSGIILIDMIDVTTEEEKDRLLQALREGFKADRIKTVVHDMTELGLIEMTRKRTGPSLTEMLECSCPRCNGSGRIGKEEVETLG